MSTRFQIKKSKSKIIQEYLMKELGIQIPKKQISKILDVKILKFKYT